MEKLNKEYNKLDELYKKLIEDEKKLSKLNFKGLAENEDLAVSKVQQSKTLTMSQNIGQDAIGNPIYLVGYDFMKQPIYHTGNQPQYITQDPMGQNIYYIGEPIFNIVDDNGQPFYPIRQQFYKKYILKIVKLQDNMK